MTWYYANGSNATTCRHFNISRSTFYRWLKRYHPDQPHKPLKSLSRRPHTKRKPIWLDYHLVVLSHLAEENPGWGRGRLQVALAARGWVVSQATVGRMLQIINRGCPVCGRPNGNHWDLGHWGAKARASGGGDTRLVVSPRRWRRPFKSKATKEAAIETIRLAKAGREAVEQAEEILWRARWELGK